MLVQEMPWISIICHINFDIIFSSSFIVIKKKNKRGGKINY